MKYNLITVILFLLPLIISIQVFAQKGLSSQVPAAVEGMEPFIDLEFSQQERDSLIAGVLNNLENYQLLHEYVIPYEVPPALNFNPVPVNFKLDSIQKTIQWQLPQKVKLTGNRANLAFYTISELAVLIKNKKITSEELTRFFIDRLKRYSDTLQCTITLLEESALENARKADAEIAKGNYKGPLHGIPYGIKDLLAVEKTKTTWGAEPFREQEPKGTATVVQKLNEAGAILTVKLTLGALAMGDVWFGGVTKNPWDLKQGSSGSSAGSAAATAAGLIPFAIGTETLGSIVSPSTRCGVTGLRPSYGRVSRTGAMALSWSMDKIGPICKNATDCAIVFNVIRGTDRIDATLIDSPFNYSENIDFSTLKVGYLKSLFDRKYENRANDSISLEVLKKLGAQIEPVELPDDLPVDALRIILAVESASAFDQLTRTNQDTLMKRQDRGSWPNSFRSARFIPAVEYVQANRVRYELVQEVYAMMKDFDVIVSPSFGGDQLLITNLVGTPCAVVPNGFNNQGSPTSISFLGNLFDEATILAVAAAYQKATPWDEEHPPMFLLNNRKAE